MIIELRLTFSLDPRVEGSLTLGFLGRAFLVFGSESRHGIFDSFGDLEDRHGSGKQIRELDLRDSVLFRHRISTLRR